jgi:hypothetical protein
MVRHTSIRAVAHYDMALEHMDVKIAFFFMVIWRRRFTWSIQKGFVNLNRSTLFVN